MWRSASMENRRRQIQAFFEMMGARIRDDVEWKNWLGNDEERLCHADWNQDGGCFLPAFPYVENPSTDRVFAPYFAKSWATSFWATMQNTLTTIFSSLCKHTFPHL